MADAQLVEITKSGHYVQDETWLLRPRLASEAGTIHEYCGQVLLFITRRPDCVRVRGELKNEGYDPTRAQGHYGSADLRHELDGPIRFKEFICTTPSTTLRVEVDPDSIACTVGAYPIRQASTHTVDDGFGGFTAKSPPHVLPPQRVFAWDFMVYETSEIPYADVSTRHAILRGSGEGWAVDGPLAYWQHPWFSPNQAFLPEPTTEYQHTTGQTGLAAVRAWGAEYLYDVLHVLNGTVDMNPAGGAAKSGMWYTVGSFGGDQYGWFCPSTYRDNYDPGGGGIMLQNGFDPDYFTQRALWLESRHKVQADCSGIMDITTGLPLTSIVAAANNVVGPGEVNYSPLYGSPNNQWLNREWHWFLPPAAANTAAEDQRRPTDRLWSQLPPLSPTTDPLFVYAEPLEVQSKCGPVMDPTDVSSGQSSDLQNWGAADIDHDVRIHSCYIALAWLRNSSWAKYQLRRKASRVEYLFSYVPVRGQASAGEDFSFPNQDMTMTKYRMDQSSDGGHVPSTNSDNYGGFLTANSAANGGTFSLYRTRGAAHACNVQAAAGAVTPSTAPDYADRQNWWARYLATSIVGATEFGCFERESSRDRQGTLRGDPEQSNHPWGGSPWDPTSVIPKHYSCGQWWKTAWYACRHFSANKVYGDATTYANNIRQFCDTQAFSMFRVAPAGARVAGRTRPMHFIISSGGTWGQEEKPGAIPVSWDVKNADGSPSLADTRVCQLMVESLRGLDEMGETTLYNELLGYVKVFFGLTEAHSLSALAGVLFAEMNRDMRPNQRWAAGYVSDLLGFIQYKQRLGETGGQLQTQLEGRGLPSRPVPVSTIKAQYDAGTWTWSYNYSMPPLTSPKDFLGEHFIGAKSTLLYHSDTSGDLRDMTVSNFVASGSRGDGLKSNGGVGPRTINVSKFHIYGLGFGPDAHADGYQTRGNLISGTFTDGFFDQPCNEGDGTKSNACLFLNNEQGTGDIGTIDVTRCILRGGNYVIFVSDNGVVNLRNTAIIVEEDSPRYGLFNTVDTSRPGSPPGSVTADDDTAIYYYNGTTCTELARGAAVLSFDFLAWHNGMFGRDPAN
ncbi:MAG: hypothetical protein KDB61_00215 [Planctomycetes bacterium]|nr:hypothetical protein [Planctomycetota bacterium]